MIIFIIHLIILILVDKLKRKFKINKKVPTKLIHKNKVSNKIKIINKMKSSIAKSSRKQN